MSGLDSLLQRVAQFGNKWSPEVKAECEKIFTVQQKLEFSEERAASVQVVKGLKYGPHERHRLDVYAPKAAYGKRPVIVYIHGGAFVAGDNDISEYFHSNIGYFFASQGYVCILATYRLLPEARYPDGADDVARAVEWIKGTIADYGGAANNIHVIGQSAGGAHLAMALFTSRVASNALSSAIFLSAPFQYDLQIPRRRTNMFQYYGTEDEAVVNNQTSVALFRQSDWGQETAEESPKIVVMVGQYDSEEILGANFAFLEEYRGKMNSMPLFETMEGHNHISYALAIGLSGERLGGRILEIVKAISS
ncbi:uncharacterized protein DNG_08960 [Cephalotrichum gorgonifer]|uniref:BD-FAE-like domain-containing protein n=1 Tax=Cephalotrichum gorgonifer TaxID=2041049 RepID=A0AAE8SYV2_9PEZI|nr:uncharacterized protein DNG_08960 [Cephalotrichum gorgonifer]